MKRLLLIGLVVVSAYATNPPGTLACRLPLAQPVPPVDNSHGWTVRGAFVTFPAGDISIDPNGTFADTSDGRLKSVTQPYLYGGQAGATYTRRFGRWLPARIAAVSPDSSHYAYSETKIQGLSRHSRIHVVDVTSAIDRVAFEGSDAYSVADYEAEGIYFSSATGFGDVGNSGLWLLNPSSGSVKEIAPSGQPAGALGGFYLVGGGAAWYGDVAPGDRPPNSGLGPMDRLLRYDLKTKKATPWLRREGWQVEGIGFDGEGHPVVRANSTSDPTAQSEELWLVTAPGIAKQIYSGSGLSTPGFLSAPLEDSHGLWFGTSTGIFLFTPQGKLQMVSSAVGEIAGRCS